MFHAILLHWVGLLYPPNNKHWKSTIEILTFARTPSSWTPRRLPLWLTPLKSAQKSLLALRQKDWVTGAVTFSSIGMIKNVTDSLRRTVPVRFKVVINNCWATPSHYSTDRKRWSLIVNRYSGHVKEWPRVNFHSFPFLSAPLHVLKEEFNCRPTAAPQTTPWLFLRTPKTAAPCSSSTRSASSAWRKCPRCGFTARSRFVMERGSSVCPWVITYI